MSEGLRLAQEGHATLPQPLYHSFQCPFTIICERGRKNEGVRLSPSQPQPSISAPLPTPVQCLLEGRRRLVGCPVWGWLQVMCLHGMSSKLGLGWAVGRVEGEEGISLSYIHYVSCYSPPTSPLLTEAERDPVSSSGSSASVSL